MDKAGAYGIQGYGATLVERIDGDYFAVMGLALGRMVRLMGRLGAVYDFRGVWVEGDDGERGGLEAGPPERVAPAT
jgi:septum formation protein